MIMAISDTINRPVYASFCGAASGRSRSPRPRARAAAISSLRLGMYICRSGELSRTGAARFAAPTRLFLALAQDRARHDIAGDDLAVPLRRDHLADGLVRAGVEDLHRAEVLRLWLGSVYLQRVAAVDAGVGADGDRQIAGLRIDLRDDALDVFRRRVLGGAGPAAARK